MNGMLSNIGKWVFGLLAVITVGLAIYFYLGLTDAVRTNLFLNWGYILIILGIVIAFAIIAVVAYIMSKGSFDHTYEAGGVVYSGKTHGWVDLGLNFFYVTLGVALISILFSVIYKAVKK